MLYVVNDKGKKLKPKEVKVNDMLLCEDNNFYPVKAIIPFSSETCRLTTSNLKRYYVPLSIRIFTDNGFKFPELYDKFITTAGFNPEVTKIKFTRKIKIFHDIVIEKNLVNIDGIIFRNTLE
jgi:hypothetical protein